MSGDHHHSNHPSVDQSDRTVPRNLRQTADADIDLVVSIRVRKSPFWHLSVEEGCHE
ncbi:MAG: aminomethyl transferase family protein, partial [Halovenus sp.]